MTHSEARYIAADVARSLPCPPKRAFFLAGEGGSFQILLAKSRKVEIAATPLITVTSIFLPAKISGGATARHHRHLEFLIGSAAD